MRRLVALVGLVMASCGERPSSGARQHAEPSTTTRAPASVSVPAAEEPAPDTLEAESSCAFDALASLCASFREQYRATGEGWVSETCGYGETKTSTGSFAEVVLVGIHIGFGDTRGQAVVERSLLEDTVREPASETPPSLRYVLAGRIGARWFPLWTFYDADQQGESSPPPFEWTLDPSGERVEWTTLEGSRQPSAYGQVDRTVVVASRGVPMIAASATLERWQGELDLPCSRSCHRSDPAPPEGECELRCSSITRHTRSWTETGRVAHIGATERQTEGLPGAPSNDDTPTVPAETLRLDSQGELRRVCGFTPIVHAVTPDALSNDPSSASVRERSLESLRHGRWVATPGANAFVVRNSNVAILAIDDAGMTACGGGGCTSGIHYDVIEGLMPEAGIHYFAATRAGEPGCQAGTLPTGDEPTFVTVALARADARPGCGFSGFDGTARRTWVVTRVFVRDPTR